MPRPIEDLTNQTFGYWTVKRRIKKNGRTYWTCQCVCGKEKDVVHTNLVNGRSKSCGCMRSQLVSKSKLQDISGQNFGRLTAISIHHREPPKTYWKCQCACGNSAIVEINSLTQGKVKSCGCLSKEWREEFGRKNYHDLQGRQFGRLFVQEDSGKRTKSGNVIWNCVCECGNQTTVAGTHLLDGTTNSCGCVNSKGELKIQTLLRENHVYFIQQYTFSDCINPKTGAKLRFDFYLPEYNRCIEFDGEQHYQPRAQGYFTKEKVQEIQERDFIKTNYCKNHDIDLIRILWYNIDNIKIEDLIGEVNAKI